LNGARAEPYRNVRLDQPVPGQRDQLRRAIDGAMVLGPSWTRVVRRGAPLGRLARTDSGLGVTVRADCSPAAVVSFRESCV